MVTTLSSIQQKRGQINTLFIRYESQTSSSACRNTRDTNKDNQQCLSNKALVMVLFSIHEQYRVIR